MDGADTPCGSRTEFLMEEMHWRESDMDVYSAISARKTIRDFEDRPVEHEVLRRILSAGLNAPSHNHMREWKFIVVDDFETRQALVQSVGARSEADAEAMVDNWGMTDEVQRRMYVDAIPKQRRMILSAGALIIPCFRQQRPLLEPETLSSLNAFASIWCCIENVLVAAAAEGIFGVTRIPSPADGESIRSVLSIPLDYEVPCYLALGYPKPGAKRAKQHEANADEHISLNKWGNPGMG
jgi:nitroreductase